MAKTIHEGNFSYIYLAIQCIVTQVTHWVQEFTWLNKSTHFDKLHTFHGSSNEIRQKAVLLFGDTYSFLSINKKNNNSCIKFPAAKWSAIIYKQI